MNQAAAALLERIRREGAVKGQVIKVDRFLNHMVDPLLMEGLGEELAGRFAGQQIDKVLTAETSGIMIAQVIAHRLGVPFIYAKKKRPLTMGEFYAAASYSFTKQESTTLHVSREVLGAGERVLFADDFFAQGSTLKAIEQIVEQAGATLVGSAVIINKSERRDIAAVLTMDELRPLGESA
ncbi:xanthine phosphoribosyltransferase [Desulfuromonas versatilis]|uniref:Xanthine phosphoribosyltransferase n=1 Tax=Desulfuromonas versatilis TaxID=2802975 RepID=A0ABM8HUS9_9BACT|nr:phosphoribosyltransferase family protein [Desulfuromonas versatilis]BCR04468.1 xanthine phosphoribosyltransferase [Desulfuromonas versatilis]